MNCEQAAEFVSALCDGEVIPRLAAEHIRGCDVCRGRLKEYAEIGAELRRAATLERANQELSVAVLARAEGPSEWEAVRRMKSNLWWKGWRTVRIPKFVVALLVVAIVALGSTLVMVKAHARGGGTVLALSAKPADDGPIHCWLSLEDEKLRACSVVTAAHAYKFRVISATEEAIELGVRTGSNAEVGGSTKNLDNLTEVPYSFEPGRKLEIPVPNAGTMVVAGELLDHIPAYIAGNPSEPIDPKAGELRLLSPVLVRGKEVIADLGQQGVLTTGVGIEIYVPNDVYYFSLSPIPGAIEGRIETSRVSFELNGEPFTVLTGAPIARGPNIWILHLANFTPLHHVEGHSFVGGISVKDLLAQASGKS